MKVWRIFDFFKSKPVKADFNQKEFRKLIKTALKNWEELKKELDKDVFEMKNRYTPQKLSKEEIHKKSKELWEKHKNKSKK